jgi:hypothetical protein
LITGILFARVDEYSIVKIVINEKEIIRINIEQTEENLGTLKKT